MKQTILTSLFFLAFLVTKATILIVDPNLVTNGNYNNLQTAIDAATAGDTLYIIPMESGAQSLSGTVAKKLTFIGNGYNPQNLTKITSSIYSLDFNTGGKGSVLMGLQLSSVQSLSNGIITNCRSDYNSNNTWYIGDSCVIKNSIIGNLQSSGKAHLIINNILSNCNFSAPNSQIIIAHNNFISVLGYSNSIALIDGIVSDNIFYDVAIAGGIGGITNSIFNKNLVYNSTANTSLIWTTPFGNNLGDTAITANPMFINFSGTPSNFYYSANLDAYNFQLSAASLGHNAASDGSDIGMYGGTYPMRFPLLGNPNLPSVQMINVLNAVIPPAGILNTKVKANAN